MAETKQVLIHTDKNGGKWFAPILPYTQRIWVGEKLIWDRAKDG